MKRTAPSDAAARLAVLVTVLNDAPMLAIAGVRRDGRMFFWNRAAERMFGIGAERALNLALVDVMGCEDNRRRVAAAIDQALAGAGVVALGQLSLEQAGGLPLWLEMSLLPRGEAGRVHDLLAIGIDVSGHVAERQRVAEEAIRGREELREKVRSRTLDLLQAKEAAEQAACVKSEFLTRMSHELRTPLHAILSFADLGATRLEQLPAEKIGDYFRRIGAAGDRLLQLVEDLLDLSRLEAGRPHLRRQRTDLHEVLRETLAELEPLADAKGLDVGIEPRASDNFARVDRQRIAQVIHNLLGNAIKFTADGGIVRLRLSDARLPAGRRAGDRSDLQPAIRIEVADHGIGIPEGELESIFEKFVQSSATRDGAGGSGLGLAICREIVAAHRGRIRAFNNRHGGASIEVLLPRDEPRFHGEPA